MKRREFITLIGGAIATWPLAARAQPRPKLARLGVLLFSKIEVPPMLLARADEVIE